VCALTVCNRTFLCACATAGWLQEEKTALREALTAHDAARDRHREELKAARGALRFRSAEEIDAECARLEATIAHSTLSLSDEKKLLLQIKELQKQKADVAGLAEKQAKLSDGDDARKALVERINAKNAEVEAIKAERTALQAQLGEKRAKDEALMADVPALQTEREATWAALQASRAQLRQLREQHKAAEDAWWANEKLFRQQQREEKQRKCVAAGGSCHVRPLLFRVATSPHALFVLNLTPSAVVLAGGKSRRRSARRARRRGASSRRRTLRRPLQTKFSCATSSAPTSPPGLQTQLLRQARRRLRRQLRRRTATATWLPPSGLWRHPLPRCWWGRRTSQMS